MRRDGGRGGHGEGWGSARGGFDGRSGEDDGLARGDAARRRRRARMRHWLALVDPRRLERVPPISSDCIPHSIPRVLPKFSSSRVGRVEGVGRGSASDVRVRRPSVVRWRQAALAVRSRVVLSRGALGGGGLKGLGGGRKGRGGVGRGVLGSSRLRDGMRLAARKGRRERLVRVVGWTGPCGKRGRRGGGGRTGCCVAVVRRRGGGASTIRNAAVHGDYVAIRGEGVAVVRGLLDGAKHLS